MTRFIPNRNFQRQMQREPKYRKAIYSATRQAERAAKAAASSHKETGSYMRGFRIAPTPEGFTLGNTDFAAHIIEWGSAKQPPQAPLRRGVRAAGLRLDEKSK